MNEAIQLNDIAGIEAFSSQFNRLGDNYIISRISDSDTLSTDNGPEKSWMNFNQPVRLNGLLLVMVQTDNLEFQINHEVLTINSGDMVVVGPGSLINFTAIERPADLIVLFIATSFLHSINIDLNTINLKSMVSHQRPLIKLNATEAGIIRKYFELLDINATNNPDSIFAKQIARSLIATIVYELFRFSFNHLAIDDTQPAGDRSGRPINYVHEFIHLLRLHYTKERNMSFYADKLCISPKYLSMITKEATGKTVSDWINAFVIIEAKNLLRFSGKSVQQVAYALNFSSQSSFGKYFKRITGLSPSEYQKS